MPCIGVLALQGNFTKHMAVLDGLNIDTCEVREPEDLAKIDGLIIPGGESSALLKLMAPYDFLDHIKQFHAKGGALFGTCAGLILLAKQVSPPQDSLELLNISVSRNAYGRQLESFVSDGNVADVLGAAAMPMVFIRAPKIDKLGTDVSVIGRCHGVNTCVRQGRVLAASFHPEMTEDSRLHAYFVEIATKVIAS